jgi:hypothetical protein
MKIRLGMKGRGVGGSARRTNRNVWPPEDARDEWWLDETSPAACERLLAERRAGVRWVFRWLFLNGGMSVVFLSGLMAVGILSACFKSR